MINYAVINSSEKHQKIKPDGPYSSNLFYGFFGDTTVYFRFHEKPTVLSTLPAINRIMPRDLHEVQNVFMCVVYMINEAEQNPQNTRLKEYAITYSYYLRELCD